MKVLTPAQRLIVAADFKPEKVNGRNGVWTKVLGLATKLKGTGVYLKVNSALRACGYELIDEIHQRDLQVMADLKLFDIKETLGTDGALLWEANPALLTVSCLAEVAAMQALKAELPATEVLGVTVLTSHDLQICKDRFKVDSVEEAATMLAELAYEAGLGGVISSAKEAQEIRTVIGREMSINTPAIRPAWAMVKDDDQNKARIMTPADAIYAGADRIIVGRPILNPPNGMTSYDAVMRTIDEIAEATP